MKTLLSCESGNSYNWYHRNFYNQLPELTQSFDNKYNQKWIKDNFVKKIESGSELGYVFIVDPNIKIKDIDYDSCNGKLLGCCFFNKTGMCYLFVDENYRNQGIANKLIEYSSEILPSLTMPKQPFAKAIFDKSYSIPVENNLHTCFYNERKNAR